MKREDFVDAINTVVTRSTVNGITDQLKKPAGRKPKPGLVEMSDWYNGLSSSDREMVQRITKETSKHATFGFLCVLDGVRSFNDDDKTGVLELYFRPSDGSAKIHLNDFNDQLLHDLYNH